MDDDSSEDSEHSSVDSQHSNPIMQVEKVGLKSGVNRLKAMAYSPIVALWQESADFCVYDLKQPFA